MTREEKIDRLLLNYREHDPEKGTRVGLTLSLFDAALSRVERARDIALTGNTLEAEPLLLEAQFLVYALASGYLPPADAVAENMLRLYEYCLFCLGSTDPEKIAAVLQVLKTLQEGFLGIRKKMVELEKSGEIPPLVPLPKLNIVT